jgi:hypothetical protein
MAGKYKVLRPTLPETRPPKAKAKPMPEEIVKKCLWGGLILFGLLPGIFIGFLHIKVIVEIIGAICQSVGAWFR